MEGNDFKEMVETWEEQIKDNVPLLIIGQTGIGKTEIIREITKKLGRQLVVIHLARNSATDFLIPQIDEKTNTVKFAVNENLKKLEKGNMVLLLDEFDRSQGDVRNAILSLINERVFDNLELPDDVAIVLLANQEFSQDTNQLNEAEFTRCSVWKIDISNMTETSSYFQYWTDIAKNKFNVNSKILSFLTGFPDYLFKLDETGIGQFATPRNWINLSKSFRIFERLQTAGAKRNFLQSFLGTLASSKFLAFLDIYSKLPKAEELINHYKDYNIKTIEQKIAVIDILSSYARNKGNENKVVEVIHNNLGDEFLFNFIILADDKVKKNLLKLASTDKALYNTLLELSLLTL